MGRAERPGGGPGRSGQRRGHSLPGSLVMKMRAQGTPGDGVDRRGMLACMAWVGTGLVWTLRGGGLASRAFGQEPRPADAADFAFVQISDSHIGFMKEPNRDVVGTLQ